MTGAPPHGRQKLGLMQVLEYSRTVYLSHGTWIYVTRAAEHYYYTTTLVKPFTDKNVDLKKADLAGFGGVVRPVRPPPPGYGPGDTLHSLLLSPRSQLLSR